MNSLSTQQLILGSGVLSLTGNTVYVNQTALIAGGATTGVQSGITGSVTISQTMTFIPNLTGISFSLGNNLWYINTGTGIVNWTLPALSTTTGRQYFIKNRGNTITLTGQLGDNIVAYFPAPSLTINSGESYIIGNGGLYWEVM